MQRSRVSRKKSYGRMDAISLFTEWMTAHPDS
jgi:hypothetical protein